MCLVGPNGAGKSTVLKTLSGLLRPRAGRDPVPGRGDLAPVTRAGAPEGIVHVTQERSLFPLMTVWDNVLMGGHVSPTGARAPSGRGDRGALPARRRATRTSAPASSPAVSRSSSRSRAR